MSDQEKQTHKLADTDISLLRYVTRHQQAVFSGLLSNLAMRLGYKVTENTQFTLSQDMSELNITELPELEDPKTKDSGAIKTAQ